MLHVVDRIRRQTSVYWALIGPDSNGLPTYADPIEVTSRWENVETEISDTNAFREISRYRALVYVDRVMYFGDYIQQTSLDSGTPADPREAASFQIVTANALPSLHLTVTLHTVVAVPSPMYLAAKMARGIEAITYHKLTGSAVTAGVLAQTTAEVEIPIALGYAPGIEPALDVYGTFQTTDRAWDISKAYITEQPGFKDYFEDSSGIKWAITHIETNSFYPAWWRFITRRMK